MGEVAHMDGADILEGYIFNVDIPIANQLVKGGLSTLPHRFVVCLNVSIGVWGCSFLWEERGGMRQGRERGREGESRREACGSLFLA